MAVQLLGGCGGSIEGRVCFFVCVVLCSFARPSFASETHSVEPSHALYHDKVPPWLQTQRLAQAATLPFRSEAIALTWPKHETLSA